MSNLRKILHRIRCAISGHQYRVTRVFSPTSRQVLCARCGALWAMNDEVRACLPWDGEFEKLYKFLGQWEGSEVKGAAP